MATSRTFYFTVWRWHFFAGLFSIPFLLLLSATGAVYLFRVEFEQWRYRDLLQVPVGPARLSHEQIVASAIRSKPGANVALYVPAFSPEESAKIQLDGGPGDHHGEGDSSQVVFVNPYSGAVLGSQISDDRFMERVKRLHGRLLAGTPGKVVIELATGWMVVLLVSGFYLWFPRDNWTVWGVFLPRLGAGKRILLRDLHAVGAVYLSLGLGLQILSGQPWTVLSSKAVVAISDATAGGPRTAQASRFHSQPPAAPAGSAQDWLGGLSVTNAGHVHSAQHDPSHGARLSLDQVAAIADSRKIVRPYQIAMPHEATGVYSVRTLSRDPRDTVYLHLDQYSGDVLASIPFAELKAPAKAVVLGIALHEGRVFGRINQLVGLAAALGSFFIAAMGAALWWSRRPKGALGGPAIRPAASVPQGVAWSTAILAVVFPFVGASIVLMWIVDRFLRRHVVLIRQA